MIDTAIYELLRLNWRTSGTVSEYEIESAALHTADRLLLDYHIVHPRTGMRFLCLYAALMDAVFHRGTLLSARNVPMQLRPLPDSLYPRIKKITIVKQFIHTYQE